MAPPDQAGPSGNRAGQTAGGTARRRLVVGHPELVIGPEGLPDGVGDTRGGEDACADREVGAEARAALLLHDHGGSRRDALEGAAHTGVIGDVADGSTEPSALPTVRSMVSPAARATEPARSTLGRT